MRTSLTDTVAVQAEYPCYWFGQHSPCWRYRLLAALTGLFTGLYLVASLCIGFLGGPVDRPDVRQKLRIAYVAVHTAAFTCEAALVALTLLKLMTEAQEPRFDGSDAAAVRQFRINVGVTAVSFSFTAVAFVGTVACFSSVLARLRGAARRVSERALARLALLVYRGAGPDAEPGAVSRAEPVGRPAAPMVTSSDGKADGAAAGEVQPGVAAGPLVHESQRAGAGQGSAWRGIRIAPVEMDALGAGPRPLPLYAPPCTDADSPC